MNEFLWQFDLDFQHEGREKSDRLQENYILGHVNYCLEYSPFYKKKLGKKAGGISSLKEFSKLGFTVKDDLLKYNSDFLSVPEEDIVDTCFTSATEGTAPVNFLLTGSDLDRLSYNEQVAFEIAGIKKKDIVAICVAMERGFMAGLAYFLGGVKLGAHMIRVGASGAQHIWNILRVHRPTVLIGVPSVLAGVATYAVGEGEDPAKLNLERILVIGESTKDRNLNLLPSSMRIEKLWNAPLFSTYASTEMASTFCECEQRLSGHFRPELIYAEIIGDDGKSVPAGEIGEVVVTPLGVRGMPLIRFRTGDISFIIDEYCPCGRTTRRIGPVLGRKSQLLKYRGTTVFPNAIVSIVEANPDFAGCYVEAQTAEFGEDLVKAFIAPMNDSYDLEKLKEQFRAGLRVVPEIFIINKEELMIKTQPAEKRKRQIFFDNRGSRK